MKGLTDIPGIRVGHASDYDGITGCTAVLCEAGAISGVSVAGSATGSEELDLLNPLHLTPYIHGICLAGGSAFGLEAVSGVRRYLEKKGIGYPTGAAKVPLVAGAILYDLAVGKSSSRPTREMGEAAAEAASIEAVKEGCVGAGTGATAGKALGIKQSMKSGLGSFTVPLPGGVLVSALVAVNPFGDVVDPATGKVIAGARKSADTDEFAGAGQLLKQTKPRAAVGENTTLGVVATNARLTKAQATKLAQLAQHGFVRTIVPVHTIYDGDIIFAMSAGKENADFTALGIAAAEAVAEAVQRAVRFASPMAGLPAAHR
jgi:L-aminopeptidase/D-esterase-like protein